jgi:galactose-1-phosphate uridylyltransferase
MNNPPAFPHVADILQVAGNSAVVKTLTQNGMTLRDYFAAKAMSAILTDPSWMGNTVSTLANMSYEVADAMLKAREA